MKTPSEKGSPRLNRVASSLRVIIHSFFVVPFLIAILALVVFLAVRILTVEPRSAEDYLNDVKIGGTTKRWQAAFELSKLLAVPRQVPHTERFVQELKAAFEHARHDRDPRVRVYLALAMGRTGDRRYRDVLAAALEEGDEGLVAACAYALGLIGGVDEVLIPLLEHPAPRVRLQAVIGLGNSSAEEVLPGLRAALEDPEPNVRWDAAVGLAKHHDPAGRRILLDLLNRKYLDSFPKIDERERHQTMMVAIQVAALILDPELEAALLQLRDQDPNLKIRAAARTALRQP